ncbi:MAG: hypothetical protein ACPGSB_02325 [Opitutales bacterium]
MNSFAIKIFALGVWFCASIALILSGKWLVKSEIGNSFIGDFLIVTIGVMYGFVCLWRRLKSLVIPMNIVVGLTFVALVTTDAYIESIMLMLLWFASSFRGSPERGKTSPSFHDF